MGNNTENSYLDFAENDYQFFRAAYDDGLLYGALASMGQSICERYLKHIVSEYADIHTQTEQQQQERVLHTHNLQILTRYIRDNMNIDIPDDVEISLDRINGFYN